jgi:hypothetical protein
VNEPTGQEHLTPVAIKDTSATERAMFRKCRRQWFLTVVHRLDAQTGNVNFFLGTIYHAALAVFYENIGAGHEFAANLSLDAYQRAYDEEWAKVKSGLGIAAQFAAPLYRESGSLGLEMLQNYLDRENKDPLLDSVIAVEFRVNVAIRSPKSGRKVGILSVQADVVGLKDGQVTVVDHKTASRRPNIAHLDIDDQLTAEVFSWWKHSGEFPTQAIYNVSMKTEAGPPKVLKSGALSKAKNQSTTATLYRQAIEENGLDEADYADILAHLDYRDAAGEDPLFVRDTTFRTPGQMAAFERDLYWEYRDMREVAKHPERAYPSPSNFNCPSCPVRIVCVTIQDDGDVPAIIQAGYVIADPRR